MTDIAYHPTRLRALRDQFRALRAAEFPWTADTVYLNNASIGPIPERTRRALDEFTAKRTAPHLLPDRELQAGLQAARAAVARLLNAEPAETALAPNTSYGLNLAARALPLARGDVVVVSDREFPANVYPWLLLKKQGIQVELAPCTPEGWPDEDFLVERLHDPRVRVLAVSFVQFSNGYRADLARLGAACRANGTFLVVDGIQGVGSSVLDVRETPIDILACGGRTRPAPVSPRRAPKRTARRSCASRRSTRWRRITRSSGPTWCAHCARAPFASPRTAITRWRSWSGCWMCWTSWSEAVPGYAVSGNVVSRCPSVHPAHTTNSQAKMMPPIASARSVGGGGVKSDAAYDRNNTAMRLQN